MQSTIFVICTLSTKIRLLPLKANCNFLLTYKQFTLLCAAKTKSSNGSNNFAPAQIRLIGEQKTRESAERIIQRDPISGAVLTFVHTIIACVWKLLNLITE